MLNQEPINALTLNGFHAKSSPVFSMGIILLIRKLMLSHGRLLILFGRGYKMSNITKSSALLVVIFLIVLLILGGCIINRINRLNGREYLDDIHIPLEDRQAEIIIKEWRWLLGSGEEVYYKDDDKKILLGQLWGGDDGFCPFKEGQYSVTVDDGKLTIEWCSIPGNKAIPWSKKTFDLPAN